MSLIGSEPQPVPLSAQGICLAQLFHLLPLQLQPLVPQLHLHPLAPHLHLRRRHHQQRHLLLHQIQDAQLLVVMILARLASFHSDFKGSSTMPAPLIGMFLEIRSHGVPQTPMPMMIIWLDRAIGASVMPVVQSPVPPQPLQQLHEHAEMKPQTGYARGGAEGPSGAGGGISARGIATILAGNAEYLASLWSPAFCRPLYYIIGRSTFLDNIKCGIIDFDNKLFILFYPMPDANCKMFM